MPFFFFLPRPASLQMQMQLDYSSLIIGPVYKLGADGVAPRAKMNQQRARRFKSAIAAKDAVSSSNQTSSSSSSSIN